MPTEEEFSKCQVCGRPLDQGCTSMGTDIKKSEYAEFLTTADWKEIYDLYRMVYLPTLHSYLARAKKRSEEGKD